MTKTQETMNRLAAELSKPRPSEKVLEKLNAELDRLLGTELKKDEPAHGAAYHGSLEP